MSKPQLKISTKDLKSCNAVLEDVFNTHKEDGLTKFKAGKLLKPAKGILQGWKDGKPIEEQDALRLSWRAVQEVSLIWWAYCRKGVCLDAEVLWNIACLLPGDEAKLKKPISAPKGTTSKKAQALAALAGMSKKDIEKLLAGGGK